MQMTQQQDKELQKKCFLAHFFRIQTSNSYFLFDEWQTLPIAANDEEISNFAYHGK